MTQTTRDYVTFTVPAGIQNVPAGVHSGYVDHMIITLHGHKKSQISRCMLHLERSEHPECFSDKNTMISIDVDITPLVVSNKITYQ